MKILIDMNLSPKWAGFLKRTDVEAIHWSEVGLAYAPDSISWPGPQSMGLSY
jgi:predicted nuclease of predicted toxin-antitoxin system